MPRGGRRTGTPGKSYQNRSDLRAAPSIHQQNVATNQPYGVATQQQNQLKAVPLPSTPPVPSPAPTPSTATGPLPGTLGNLHDPSTRPQEPITAGLPTGAGPGPEALAPAMSTQDAQLLNTLRGAYLAHPNEDLRQLIASMEMAQR